ncbi:MAG: hypothetical protein QOG66_2216 [Methylobacteriaceae bacterium]|jgi:hypothetical protein|nr:hypothetical protein [Methylobacteriaceae bacterium]
MLWVVKLSPDKLATLHKPRLRMVFSELLRAHRLGLHLAVIERKTAAWLMANLELGLEDNALLARLAQEYTQTGNLADRIPDYIELISAAGVDPARRGRAIEVPLETLSPNTITQLPILLCEHITRDGVLYSQILENIKDLFSVPRLAFECHHGGGSSTKDVFEAKIEERRIVCGIIDTDRRSPMGHFDRKRNQFEHLCLTWPLAFAFFTPCREAENVIPPDIVFQLQCAAGSQTPTVLFRVQGWEAISGKPMQEALWLYFDVKLGWSHETLESMDEAEVAWAEEHLAAAGLRPPWRLHGFGETVIDQLCRNGQFLAALRSAVRRAEWLTVFGSFFERMLWLFVCAHPLKT